MHFHGITLQYGFRHGALRAELLEKMASSRKTRKLCMGTTAIHKRRYSQVAAFHPGDGVMQRSSWI
jgi:hypothetical protein